MWADTHACDMCCQVPKFYDAAIPPAPEGLIWWKYAMGVPPLPNITTELGPGFSRYGWRYDPNYQSTSFTFTNLDKVMPLSPIMPDPLRTHIGQCAAWRGTTPPYLLLKLPARPCARSLSFPVATAGEHVQHQAQEPARGGAHGQRLGHDPLCARGECMQLLHWRCVDFDRLWCWMWDTLHVLPAQRLCNGGSCLPTCAGRFHCVQMLWRHAKMSVALRIRYLVTLPKGTDSNTVLVQDIPGIEFGTQAMRAKSVAPKFIANKVRCRLLVNVMATIRQSEDDVLKAEMLVCV